MISAVFLLITACASGRTTLLPDPDSYRLSGIIELRIDALFSPPSNPIQYHIQYRIDLETKEWERIGLSPLNVPGRPLPCLYTLQGRLLTVELTWLMDEFERTPDTEEWRTTVLVYLEFSYRDGDALYGPFRGSASRMDVVKYRTFEKYRQNEVWNGTVTGRVIVNPGEPERIRILPPG